MSRTFVDWKSVVITPFQKSLNRLQEISRGDAAHGSTGSGLGVARSDHIQYKDQVLFASDLINSKITTEKLIFLRNLCLDRVKELVLPNSSIVKIEMSKLTKDVTIASYLEAYKDWCESGITLVNGLQAIDCKADIVFEGGQGILLDEKYGFGPHITWTDITFNNALSILKDANFKGEINRIGVTRSYLTRHGNGPFPSEASELEKHIPKEEHNTGIEYTGKFRVGYLNIPWLLYGVNCLKGIDSLAVNHLDVAYDLKVIPVQVSGGNISLVAYKDLVPTLEELLKVTVSITGFGPSRVHKTRMLI